MLSLKEKIDQLGASSKKIVEIGESLTRLNEQLDSSISKIGEVANSVKKLEARIASQEKIFENLSEFMERTKNKVEKNVGSLSSEINRLSEGRRKLVESVYEKAVDSISGELEKKLMKFEQDSERYSRFMENLEQVNREISKTAGELEKFRKISEKIKSTDFDMRELVKKVEQLSMEKKSLLDQRDRLQRLIAKERRR